MALEVNIKIDASRLGLALRKRKLKTLPGSHPLIDTGRLVRSIGMASLLPVAGLASSFARAVLAEIEASQERLKALAAAGRQVEDLHRGNWWQRGEEPPTYRNDDNDPEWWRRDDESPDFGCAA